MASKKSTAASHSRSQIRLTQLDKLALVAAVLGDDCIKTEQQICDYAVDLKSSPFMLRFLRAAIDAIVEQHGEDRETAIALCIAELHFASNASLAC